MAAYVLQRLLSGEITARPDPDEGLGRYYEPFVFDRNLRTQPTEFDIVFLAEVGDGTSAIFNYQLSYNADRICVERLFSRTTKPRARDRELFTRKWNSESGRSEEHTSELQSLMRISHAVFCLKKKHTISTTTQYLYHPELN